MLYTTHERIHEIYSVPSTLGDLHGTSNMKTLATTFLIASKSCPFDSAATAFYSSTPDYFSFKINSFTIHKIDVRSPAHVEFLLFKLRHIKSNSGLWYETITIMKFEASAAAILI